MKLNIAEYSEYGLQNRGGFGKINYKVSETKGHVIGIRAVDDSEDLLLVSDDGIIIRIRVSDVSIMSRYAGGVRVMRVNEGARLVSFVRAEHDDGEEVTTVEKASKEELEADAAAKEEAKALEAELEQEETASEEE